MNCKINIDKFICFLIENKSDARQLLEVCLKSQGLEYKDGKIVELDQQPLTEEQGHKFNIGDWIASNDEDIHNDYRVCRISKIENDRYYIDDGFLNKNTIEQYSYHKWTIQDAKNGDVLVDDKGSIFIFRGIGNQEWNDVVDFYVALGSPEKEIIIQYDIDFWGTVETAFMPATKEQRALLFQKMKEAGYTWNQDMLKLEKKRLFSTIRFDEPKTKDELIELRDDKGEKVLVPKKKFLEKVNEIRNEEDDYIWPKDMIDQLHNEIAAGTPKVEAELRKYFANIFPYLYNVDVDKMTRDYSSGLLHSGYVGPSYFDRQIAYKRGIEDILELIKKGGEE